MKTNKCVCILTAGVGSRLKQRTEYFNKALLRVGNKAVISHTIDAFSNDTDFVIALGYKGDIVKQYLEIAHPDRNFIFVWTDKYSEAGAGPGYAMLQCKESLQRPFFYVACDSIIDWTQWELSSQWKYSWVHVAKIEQRDTQAYCTVELKQDNKIKHYYNKSKEGTDLAFTGVAYIQEYKEFWTRLEKAAASEGGEIPNAPAMLEMDNVHAVWSQWFDTGTEEGLLAARKHFKGIENLDKLDEELYVVGDTVVKYFHNANMVKHRAQRVQHLSDMTPKLTDVRKNFYRYDFVPGVDLFKVEEPQYIMRLLLENTQSALWGQTKQLTDFEETIFRDVCKKFYYDKTMSRLSKLYRKCGMIEERSHINGRIVPSLDRLFQNINWDYLSEGIPAKFHGDYNFSNIVWNDQAQIFKFLDWRQDFGGSIEFGDIYYDFAKMYHGFLFPHPSVKRDKFYIKKLKGGKIKTFIEIPYEIAHCKDIFEEFIETYGYDFWKIRVLTAIVLLNMSPLHEAPIDEYLYYFAKDYLNEVLNEV